MKQFMQGGQKGMAWFLAVLMLLGSCVFAAPASEAAAKKKVTSVTLVKPEISTLTLKKGTSYQLRTKVLPKKASNKKLRFRSSKPSVVSVTKKGKLKAKKKGKATITIRSVSGNKKAKVKVTVAKSLKKVKKVTLNTKKLTLYIGGTKKQAQAALTASVSPKKATVKKVVYKAADKSIASVSKKGVVTAKKAGQTKITVYAADGWGKKAVCKVVVKKQESKASGSTDVPAGTSVPTQTAQPTPTEEPGREYVLASAGKSQQLVLDAGGADYKGLRLVAECFQKDVKMVSDADLDIVTDAGKMTGIPIIAGSIGNNQLIDAMIQNGKLDVSKIRDKWETYKIEFVKNPAEGVEEALVIAGSDKRGTIYGIFHISELMGVSPWVYWADVTPEQKDTVTLNSKTLCVTSEEPSVKYRGIFLNDEEPALGSWANNFFKKSKGGKFNEYFYENVFQLILRLKGNYLWPAMWSSAFSTDGVEMPEASAELADAYGIVMGTSHHEPMMKAHQEWTKGKSSYGNGEWNYYTNKEGLKKFFREGAARNGKYENVITIGMRGDGDAAMLPEGSSVEENISLLKEIITDQRSILKENGLENNPTLLALYKEVEDYWYGDSKTPGLCDWDGLDDTIVMLSEDNYGNIRTLPTKENKDRKGGWGMYYHVDYNGAPTSYQWVQTVQLQKMWEQMSMAYDYGVDDLWILNVGDLKPMESAISYFMDMAWDYDKWGSTNINSTEEYTRQWMEEQFGKDTDAQGIQDLTTIFEEYLKINTTRRAENVTAATYSIDNYNEAMEMLERMDQLIRLADEYKEKLPESAQAPYYELVYYPAVATANVNRMQIYAGLNQAYAKQNLSSANMYAALLEDAIAYDQELERIYDKDLPGVGNKWDGMMYQAKNAGHVGYPGWQPQGEYPVPVYVEVPGDSHMYVRLQGDSKAYDSGTASLQDFTNINNETYYVNIMNGGGTAFDYEVSTTEDWIRLSRKSGTVSMQDSIGVQVDFSKVKADSTGVVTVTGNGQTVKIAVSASVIDTTGLAEKTFVEAHQYISVEAVHYTDAKAAGGAQWKEIKNYGRGLSSLKVFPCTGRFTKAEEAPYVEYTVKTASKGKYTMLAYLAPSNNVDQNQVTMKYGVSVDGGQMQSVDTISKSYVAGTWRDSLWSNGVKNGIHTKTLSLGELSAGVHKIRIYAMDPEIVLQKFVLYPTSKNLKSSYMGPGESYYVGKNVSSHLVTDVQEEMAVAPCTIKANEKQKYTIVVPKSGSYEVAIQTGGEQTAKVNVLWNHTKAGEIVTGPDPAGDHVYAAEEIAMEQGKGELVLEVSEGSVEIQKVMINRVETVYGKPVYVWASSETGTNYATNVYNSNARLIWKAEDSDAKPYLEFDFDETVSLATLALTEKGSNVKGYEVMVQDAGDGSWRTIYTGTSIESGKAVSLKGSGAVSCQRARIVFTDLAAAPAIARADFALDPPRVAVENYTKSRLDSMSGSSVTLTKTSDIRRIDFVTEDKESTYTVNYAQKSSDLYVTVPESEYKIRKTADGMAVILDEAIPAQKIWIVSENETSIPQITLWGDVMEEREAGTKEVLNQNFESDKDKISTWASASATIVTDEKYEGKQSLKISNRNAAWSAAAINIGNLCGFTDSQSEYTFSCYLKSGSGDMNMQVKLCNGSGSDQNEATGPSVPIRDDEWTYFEYTFKMNSNEYQNLKLQTADGNTGDYYMDQVMITKPVPPCTCELEAPYITNDSTISLADSVVVLETETSIKRCDNDGHKDATIEYTYEIVEDESGQAALSGNKLTVKESGRLVLRVTARVNGLERRTFKTFEVR